MSKITYPVELPSCGFLYTDEVLHKGILNIKPMTVAEEELLSSQKESDKIKILDTLIKRCVIDKFNYDELLITDKLFLLFCIRRYSYGDVYKMKVKCEHCGFNFNYDVKFFESFKVRTLTEGDSVEPYSFKLPVCGNTITYRMLRVSDENDISSFGKNMARQKGNNLVGDPTYSYRMAKHIVDIDGEPVKDIKVAVEFVKELVGQDSAEFKNEIESRQSGVNIELNMECPDCNSDLTRIMAFSAEFFRPSRA